MYVVVENTPGCLPESESTSFYTWEEACEYANDLANRIIEDAGDRRYYTTATHTQDEYGLIRVQFPDDAGHLGRVVEITKV